MATEFVNTMTSGTSANWLHIVRTLPVGPVDELRKPSLDGHLSQLAVHILEAEVGVDVAAHLECIDREREKFSWNI